MEIYSLMMPETAFYHPEICIHFSVKLLC